MKLVALNGKAVAPILGCESFHVTTHVQTMIVKRNDEMSDSVESKVFFFFHFSRWVWGTKTEVVHRGTWERGMWICTEKNAMGNGEERNLTIVQFGG